MFTLDSGHEVGKGDGSLAKKNQNIVKMNEQQHQVYLRTWPEDMKRAAQAKYEQWAEGRKILLLTGDAKLIHLMTKRGSPSVFHRFEHLEEIRDACKTLDTIDSE